MATSYQFLLCHFLLSTATTYSLLVPSPRIIRDRKTPGRITKSASCRPSPPSSGTPWAAGLLFATNERKSLEGSSAFTFEKRKQQRDVVIVGGALAGLSTALYLSQMDPTRHITILDREDYGAQDRTSAARSPHAQPASFAAAGMLAPQSERLPPGPLLDLCVSSRRMYSEFCDMVETLAEESGVEGEKFLFPNQFNTQIDDGLEPWSIGFVGSGGFLAPAFAGDSVATWSPPEAGGKAQWLDSTQIRELEPHLHSDVVGGWWFPDDASVDARRLTCSLRAACVATGVQLLNAPQYEVSSLDLIDGKCRGVFLKTAKGQRKGQRYIGANTVLIANGAWMRDLLPVPIEPHKGQSLALRMPADRPPLLRRVLFAQDTYIVPKADGRIIVGATVEAGSFDANVTPSGIMHILTHALQLVPGLSELPIEESWVGLRPTTPDKGPILGATPWNNVFVAGGYWRNGVLLAPKTGQLMASLIMKSLDGRAHRMDPFDESLLEAFAWDRFTAPEKTAALTANMRYASSMHPIHKRGKSSATMGAELGTYSTARASAEDRKKDRDALFGDGDAAFERAAQLGKEDIAAYDFGQESVVEDEYSFGPMLTGAPSPAASQANGATILYDLEGAADALTVGIANSNNNLDESDVNDSQTRMDAIYEKIRASQAERQLEMSPSENETDDRPDPGFRIYHVDSETGEEREVPPYTAPLDFLKSIGKSTEKTDKVNNSSSNDDGDDGGYSGTTYDGYQAIEQANSRRTRDEELDAMREARKRNRLDQSAIDESEIGALPWKGKPFLDQ
jgi:glycine oxidase